MKLKRFGKPIPIYYNPKYKDIRDEIQPSADSKRLQNGFFNGFFNAPGDGAPFSPAPTSTAAACPCISR